MSIYIKGVKSIFIAKLNAPMMLQRYIIKMRNSTKAKFIFIVTTYKCCIAKVIRFG